MKTPTVYSPEADVSIDGSDKSKNLLAKCAFRGEGGHGCKATTYARCPDNCKFYRTSDDIKKNNRKADRRIRSLPEERQIYIAEMYYQRRAPWNCELEQRYRANKISHGAGAPGNRTGAKKVTEEERVRVGQMLAQGYTNEQIALELGRCIQTITGIRKRLGIPWKPGDRRGCRKIHNNEDC